MFSGPSHTERHCKKGPVRYACPCLVVEASESLSAKQFLGKKGWGRALKVSLKRSRNFPKVIWPVGKVQPVPSDPKLMTPIWVVLAHS